MLELQLKRWKRVEYERLVDRGVFEPGDRVELIDGLLLVAEPQSSLHYTAVLLVERALARAFGDDWIVNLIDRVLEIGREPRAEPSAPYGWDYARVDVLGPSERVTALGAPGVEILVADLLP